MHFIPEIRTYFVLKRRGYLDLKIKCSVIINSEAIKESYRHEQLIKISNLATLDGREEVIFHIRKKLLK
jgi:hypothetical protein